MSQTRFGPGGELETISFSLTVDVRKVVTALEPVLDLLSQWLAFTHRLNLPEDVEAQLRSIHRVVVMLNTLRTTYALTAATTPIGLLLAIPTAYALGYQFVESIGSFT